MSLITQLNYDTSGNFTFDSSKVEFSPTARLKLQVGALSFNQSFTSSAGFTYDSSKLEFSAGLLRQLSQLPASAVLGSTFTSSKNASWPSGVAAVDVGAPVLSGGELSCPNGNNGIYYQSAAIGAVSPQGSMRFIYRPSYSGTPAANVNMFELTAPASNNDKLLLFHSVSGGTLRATVYNNIGVIQHSALVIGIAWAPVAGQAYEILLAWDTAASIARLFINGTLHGTLGFGFVRGTSATRLHLGAGVVYPSANASFDKLALYSTPIYTAGYTPGYSLPETTYVEASAALPLFTHAELGTILSLTSGAQSGSAQFTVDGKYWNGSAWAASNGSYAQSSDLSQVSSLGVSGYGTLSVNAVFPASNSQGLIDSLTLNYSGNTEYPSNAPSALSNSATDLDDLLSFAAESSVDVRFTLLKGNVEYYHNGSAWAIAGAGNYNTAAEIQANAASFTTSGVSVRVKAYLLSDGQEQTYIDSVSYSYDFFYPEPAGPARCIVFGFIGTMLGTPVGTDFKIRITNEAHFMHSGHLINRWISDIAANVEGYWESELVETETVSKSYLFTVLYVDYKGKARSYDLGRAEVPNLTSVNIADLVFQ